MSSEITTAFVQQYSANVFHLSQQKGSRLRPAVRQESQVGKSAFYDRIGKAVAQVRSSRHADTPQIDTPHTRRRVTLVDYEYADLVDEADKIRLLMDPTSEYALAAVWGLGRAMDDVIIDNALGTAYGDEAGSTSVSLTQTQIIASVAAGAGANLNVGAVIATSKKLDTNDVDPDIQRYFAFNASMKASMLGQTQVTSADYNSVKALVQGQIDSFMGFRFIHTERLDLQVAALAFDTTTGETATGSGAAAGYRKAIGWAQDGLLLAVGKDVTARIGERADKSYSMQVYASMGIGGTRMEEEKVVSVLCDD